MKSKNDSRDVKIIIISIFIVLLMFLTSVLAINNNKDLSKDVIITHLNEEYSGKIKVVATDIKTIKVLEDDDVVYYVGVRFEVFNNSNITFGIRSTQISHYVDDVAQSRMNFASKYFDENHENLFAGDLAPGKKTMGYEVAQVQTNSKTVEFVFDNPDYGATIRFVFNIPSATELVSSSQFNS